MICIQLLVGLCAECDINIILHDATSGKELKRLIVKGSTSAKHGLPTWQFVTIEHLANRNSVIMELRSMLISNNSNPLWAIANIRQCPKYGTNLLYFLISCYISDYYINLFCMLEI